ncbi:SPOR domain-containing protein [Algiphilus sp. NNCM1]|uniref:SPOR domain-containing protein n=1 Tax=Algiphilus sp. TaxID=1872431 RepID=UPI001CA6B379|nr:SPOR domain-containing protein [Algiphilus sp.]MBY8965067.1 SPOR domain-containing protein [Algiphilus acroporae]MCI5063460.1 SPOR domain-containing protein [Algiphilus sp.]MCI5104220.1 SPOR domain-containing protein [Algiphilus sp.]
MEETARGYSVNRCWLTVFVATLLAAITPFSGVAQEVQWQVISVNAGVSASGLAGERVELVPGRLLPSDASIDVSAEDRLTANGAGAIIGVRGEATVNLQTGRSTIRVEEGEASVRVPPEQHVELRSRRARALMSGAEGWFAATDGASRICAASGVVEVELLDSGHTVFLREARECVSLTSNGALSYEALPPETLEERMFAPTFARISEATSPPASPPPVRAASAPRLADEPPTQSTEAVKTDKDDVRPDAQTEQTVGRTSQVAVSKLVTVPDGNWFVVLGAFSSEDRARRFREGLVDSIRSRASVARDPGNDMHRVLVGPFAGIETADEARLMLRTHFPGAWIIEESSGR